MQPWANLLEKSFIIKEIIQVIKQKMRIYDWNDGGSSAQFSTYHQQNRCVGWKRSLYTLDFIFSYPEDVCFLQKKVISSPPIQQWKYLQPDAVF